MLPATLKALKATIAHWKRLADGTFKKGERPSGLQCELCALFFLNRCTGCPVADAGHTKCQGTPFMDAYSAWDGYGPKSAEFRAAAQKEVEFLEIIRLRG